MWADEVRGFEGRRWSRHCLRLRAPHGVTGDLFVASEGEHAVQVILRLAQLHERSASLSVVPLSEVDPAAYVWPGLTPVPPRTDLGPHGLGGHPLSQTAAAACGFIPSAISSIRRDPGRGITKFDGFAAYWAVVGVLQGRARVGRVGRQHRHGLRSGVRARVGEPLTPVRSQTTDPRTDDMEFPHTGLHATRRTVRSQLEP